MNTYTNTKLEALAVWIKDFDNLDKSICQIVDDLTYVDLNTYSYANKEFLILTNKEADDHAKDYIKETLWTFHPGVLVNYMKGDENINIEILKYLQEKYCEDLNLHLLKIIGDKLDNFVDDVLLSYSRSHLLDARFGTEHEIFHGDEWFYIHRTN